jgi:hypothetical protein
LQTAFVDISDALTHRRAGEEDFNFFNMVLKRSAGAMDETGEGFLFARRPIARIPKN